MIIRKARQSDIKNLVALGKQFYDESNFYGNCTFSPSNIQFTLAWMVEFDTILVLVAEDDDGTIAAACIWQLDSSWTEEKIAMEVLFYVKPEYRKKGTAKLLLDESVRLCDNAGAPLMYSTSTAGFKDGGVNARAYNMLFSSFGFKPLSSSSVLVRERK